MIPESERAMGHYIKQVFIVNEQAPLEDNVDVAVFSTEKAALRRKLKIQERFPDNAVWVVEADLNLATEEFIFNRAVDFSEDISEAIFLEEREDAHALLRNE
tara:strand:+ start:212 stop:517 length:306 start_codon:yes stop_codon:yes gene_type:complete